MKGREGKNFSIVNFTIFGGQIYNFLSIETLRKGKCETFEWPVEFVEVLRFLEFVKGSICEGFMKKDGFNMSDNDDKPFECTAPGCGQVSVFFQKFL